MKKPIRLSIKKTQTGTTLIEVLVALLVFTIGLQGVASLQYQAMKNNFDSAQRSHGAWAAHELINRIRANKSGREAGEYIVTDFDPCPVLPASCVNSTCTSTAMAAFDINDAICQGSLLNPTINISCADAELGDGFTCSQGSDFTLTLEWNSKSVSDDSDIDTGQVTQQFQQVFQP
jgi:type IV pilus assembly protein PilV